MLKGEKELRKALGDGRADDFLMVWFMLRKLDPGTDKILEVSARDIRRGALRRENKRQRRIRRRRKC